MKKIVIFLLVILLSGCAGKGDLKQELDAVFSADSKVQTIRRNNYSSFIDYYVPSDTGELEGTKLSSNFSYNESRFVMDINVSGIINDRYYRNLKLADEGFFDDARKVYARQSSYVDSDGSSHEYIYKVYEYDDRYLSYFASKELVFYGYATAADIVNLSSRILLMAKGATVRENDVIASYSSRNEIDYEKKQVNLFETIMPVNGNVNDFLVDREDTGASQ